MPSLRKAGISPRAAVRELPTYEEEAPPGALNLMNNMNLFGPNPAVARALSKARPDQFGAYPTPQSDAFRRAAAQTHGVSEDMIVTGNGSNELIDLLVRAFVEPGDAVAYHPPTFVMIPIFTLAGGGMPAPAPLSPGAWGLDPSALVDRAGKITFVCRPNNPTGNAFPRREVERVVAEADGLVVVDEAYIEFCGGSSFADDVRRNPQLVVLRTLSKAHGMAGLRVGYAIANPDVAQALEKVRGPFRLNAFSELAGTIALSDRAYVEGVVAEARSERNRLIRLLEEEGFRVFPSETNFLFVRPPVDARALARALRDRGVHVRDFAGDVSAYLRITVGPPGVTARLLPALREALTELRSKGGAG